MTQIGILPQLAVIKNHFRKLQEEGLIAEWELPYEEILTRSTAAIFFLTPSDNSRAEEIWEALGAHHGLQYRLNEDGKLSKLMWRLEFK